MPELSLAHHAREIQGNYCLTFRVRSPDAAATYLRNKGFDLIGNTSTRFAINPGRRIYFTGSPLM